MAWTKHGHHIPGTTMEDDRPIVHRCGGPMLCSRCSWDVQLYLDVEECKKNHPAGKNKEKKMDIKKFVRKPVEVDAVQVTAENLEEVAVWVAGMVKTNDKVEPVESYVKVRVHRPLSNRQTMAFPGDWVLRTRNGFKVYTPNAFSKQFDLVDEK